MAIKTDGRGQLELVEFFDNAILLIFIIWRKSKLELVEFFDNAIFFFIFQHNN